MRRWFLSYHSPDQALAERLKAAIEQKDASSDVFFAPTKLRAGGRWAPPLADAIAEADAFVLLVTDKGVGRWQEIEYDAAFDRHVASPDFPVVLVLLEGQAAPRLAFLKQVHWVITSDPASDKNVARLIDAVNSHSDAKPGELWRYTSPYRGLAAMEEKDCDYFFGRERETIEVLNALAAEPGRLPVLLGNSGGGKSSLAHAVVIASLRRQAWPGGAGGGTWPAAFNHSRSWCFLSLKPGAEPINSLVEAFLRTWQYDATDPKWEERQKGWVEALFNGSATLRGLLDATERRYAEIGQLKPPVFFLYIDQGEELYVRGEPQRRRFSELHAQAVADPRLIALMSMRSDFLGHLQSDERLFAVHRKIDVPPLREAELLRVISEPARQLAARFESEELVGVITRRTLEDSAQDVGALPLLSYTLDDMWTEMVRRRDGMLRLPTAAFELGGVLAERANAFLTRNPHSEGALRRVLTIRLATVRKEGEPTRRRARRSEFSDDEWRLVSELADDPNRLLVTATPEGGETYAEIAHEAIFRRWDKLRDWINLEREFLAWKTTLDDDRRGWEEAPELSKSGALLLGLPLAQAQDWLVRRGEDLLRAEREFIGLSQRAENDRLETSRQLEIQRARAEEEVARLRAEREAQQQRERAAAEEVARLRAEQEVRAQQDRADAAAKRRMKRVAWAVAFLAIISLVTGYVLYQQNREITQSAVVANLNFKLAVSSAQMLLDQVSTSLDHGDMTGKAAFDALMVAKRIVEQVHNTESMVKSVGPLIHLLLTTSDIYASLGNYTETYANAQQARGYAERLLAAEPGNPDVLRYLYGSVWRMGDAVALRGIDPATLQEALKDYLEAKAIAERLAAMAPEDGARQRELMFIHQKIGDIRQSQGDLDAALAEYRAALTLIESAIQNAVVNASEKRSWQRDVATTLRRIGQTLALKGDFDSAFNQLRAALEILTVLAREDPNDNIVQSNLAANHRDIGDVYVQRGDLTSGYAEYDIAILLQKRLIARDPDNAIWQFSLASLYANLGGILAQQGDLAGALERYRMAYAIRQKLALADPTNPARQNRLAKAAILVADLLEAQKQNLDEAVRLYREAIEIQDEIRPQQDRDIFHSYIMIGDIRVFQNKRDEALAEYKRAWAIARDFAASSPNSVISQRNLATVYVKIGDVLASQGQSRGAAENYQQALEIAAKLAANYPKSVEWPALVESLKGKIQELALQR